MQKLTENLKILLDKIKDLRKWRNIPYSRLIMLKCQFSPNVSPDFQCNLKIPRGCFSLTSRFWNSLLMQRTRNSQNNLEEKRQDKEYTLPDFKIYCEVTVFKIVWYWPNARSIMINGTE